MEQKILLDSCDFNPVVNSGRYISLLDKNELTKDDLHWLELLPFIRILGITTQDIQEFHRSPEQNLHNIEGKLQSKYNSICKLLNTTSPVSTLQKLVSLKKKLQERTQELKEKQQLCINKSLKNLTEISQMIKNLTENPTPADQQNAFHHFYLRVEIINLKIAWIRGQIYNDLYQENKAKALKIIREEIENTYDEYNDIRALMKDRISVYENNQKLLNFVTRYSEIRQKIMKKREDIKSISD